VNPEPVVYAVSDATGETAEQACRAALAQFSPADMGRVRVVSHVLDEQAVKAVVRAAKESGAILAYTLVSPEVRGHMKQVTAREGVTAIDLLSTLISALARRMQRDPLDLPGLGHQLDAEYFRRVEAIEFAVNNDDGRLPHNLKNADVVVVGLSRTSKTPLSNYLAQRGYRVANVPIVLGAPLPKELDSLDPRRVFGLTIDPSVLSDIRRARMQTLGVRLSTSYDDLEQIRREASYAREVFAAHPAWTVVDTTKKAIEETAAFVLEVYRSRFEAGATAAAPARRPVAADPAPTAAERPSPAAKKPAAKPRTGARRTEAGPARGPARKGRRGRS
jgi:regulator of PEP synthase PpsR (kinase-PPPase family)